MRYPRLVITIGIAAGLLLAAHGFVADGTAQSPAIQVSSPWARRAPMSSGDMGKMEGGATGAVYATITNSGNDADALVSASSDAARTVELHEVIQDGGVMKMRPIAKIGLPAGGTVDMKPGGYHVMLLGLTRDLKPGDKVSVTLKFERAGEVKVDAPVR